MDYQAYHEHEPPRVGRVGYAVAFAFGLGAAFGGALAAMLTNLLTR